MQRLARALGLAAGLAGSVSAACAGEAGDLVMTDRGPWQLTAPLTWTMTHEGPAAPGFLPIRNGQVSLLQQTDPADGRPVLMIEQQTDGRTRRIGPYPTSGGDPAVVFFLENAARDVAALTGGSPFYIRNRIKDALFRGGEVTRGDGRVTVTLHPFASDPNLSRLHGFETLQLRFVMGDDPKSPIRAMTAETTAPVQVARSEPAIPGAPPIAPVPYRLTMVQP